MKIPLTFILLLLIPFATAIDYLPNNALNPTGEPFNTAIVPSDDPVWSYESNGLYEAHFMDDSSSGQIVRFESGGTYMTLQPMALNWRNDLNQLEQISMVQGVVGTPTDNIMSYDNAYGTGNHLTYTANEAQLKEVFNITSKLAEPAQYIIDGGNAALETNFIFGTNAFTIEIDGEAWDKSTATATSSSVSIKNAAGDTLYTLPPPIAIDADGDTIIGTYNFKKSGVSLYISHRTPKTWLDTANYPVLIDPSFQVDYDANPGELLTYGDVWSDDDSQFVNTTDVTSIVSDDDDLTYLTLDKHSKHILTTDDDTDGSFETIQLITLGNIAAVDYTLPDINRVTAMQVCVFASQKKATPDVFDLVNNLTLITSITLPVTAIPNTWSCFLLNTSDFHTGINRIGVQTVDTTGGQSGHIGRDTTTPQGTSYYWDGATWALQGTYNYGIKISYTEFNLTSGLAFSGHWSQTYDSDYEWFLKVRKLTTGITETTTIAYSGLDTIIPSQNVSQQLNGQGWFYIPVDNLLTYELGQAMNFTHLRFFPDDSHFFTEFRLMKEKNDTTAPVITNCTVDTSTLGCDETARYSCNVVDDIGVFNVDFTINNNTVAASKGFNDTWFYDLSPIVNGSITFTLESVTSYDLFNQSSTTYPSVYTDYNCSRYIPPSNMTCLYNPEPFTTIEQDFICTITEAQNKTYHCYGITKHPTDGSIFDIKPRQEQVKLYGATTGYEATPALGETQLAKVTFSTKRLTTTQPVVFEAFCTNALDKDDWLSFERTLTPRFTTPDVIGETVYSGTSNAGYYAMLFSGLFIGLLVLFMIVRELKRR